MKVAVRGGHNFSVPGARGIIDETVEDRKVKEAVISLLNDNGVECIDCTAPDSCNTISSDLSYGVNKANNENADLFISIHFNNAYDTYAGPIGTETVVYSGFDIAQRIVNNIAELGFINRGMKGDTRGLYELKHTKMKSVIVECCFVESERDVEIYQSVGPYGLAKAIVSGILDKTITYSNTSNSVLNSSKISLHLRDWQQAFNETYNENITVDGIDGPQTQNALKNTLIKRGMANALVGWLQCRIGATVDYDFGPNTEAALKCYQRENGLSDDGQAGYYTFSKLLSQFK